MPSTPPVTSLSLVAACSAVVLACGLAHPAVGASSEGPQVSGGSASTPVAAAARGRHRLRKCKAGAIPLRRHGRKWVKSRTSRGRTCVPASARPSSPRRAAAKLHAQILRRFLRAPRKLHRAARRRIGRAARSRAAGRMSRKLVARLFDPGTARTARAPQAEFRSVQEGTVKGVRVRMEWTLDEAWDSCPDPAGVMHGRRESYDRMTFTDAKTGDSVAVGYRWRAPFDAPVGEHARLGLGSYRGSMTAARTARKGRHVVSRELFRVRASRTGIDLRRFRADATRTGDHRFTIGGPRRIPLDMAKLITTWVQQEDGAMAGGAAADLLDAEEAYLHRGHDDLDGCVELTVEPQSKPLARGESVVLKITARSLREARSLGGRPGPEVPTHLTFTPYNLGLEVIDADGAPGAPARVRVRQVNPAGDNPFGDGGGLYVKVIGRWGVDDVTFTAPPARGFPTSWHGTLVGDGHSEPDSDVQASWHYDVDFTVSGTGTGSPGGQGGALYGDLRSGTLDYHESGTWTQWYDDNGDGEDDPHPCSYSGTLSVPLDSVQLQLTTYVAGTDTYSLRVDWPHGGAGSGTDSCTGPYELDTADLGFVVNDLPWNGAGQIEGSARPEPPEGSGDTDWHWSLRSG